MTRKRFIKLLMAKGYSRSDAVKATQLTVFASYEGLYNLYKLMPQRAQVRGSSKAKALIGIDYSLTESFTAFGCAVNRATCALKAFSHAVKEVTEKAK